MVGGRRSPTLTPGTGPGPPRGSPAAAAGPGRGGVDRGAAGADGAARRGVQDGEQSTADLTAFVQNLLQQMVSPGPARPRSFPGPRR